ncbi:MAG TPA: CHAT domain-containing protein [Acidobacteriota bacterium]|nr:CHAT domain-containing protein [Acidobacteriota bacterium]
MSHSHRVNKSFGLSWVLVLMLGLNPFLGLAVVAQDLDPLAPGKTVDRALKGGEKHRFLVQLNANDFLNLVVNQKGIDVVVRLLGPDGKTVQEVDRPNGTQGEEPLSFIAEQTGNYTLEIESLEKAAPSGKYELKPEAIKPATEQDRAQLEIEKLFATGEQLYRSTKYDQALTITQQARTKSESTLGAEHPLTANCLNLLGALYKKKNNYDQAEKLYLQCLAIQEKIFGPEHLETADVINNLALLSLEKGDYAKAESLCLRTNAIWEKSLDPNHSSIATGLNNLAAIYLAKGEYAKAEPLYQRALAINEHNLGPNHQLVAFALNNVASFYKNKGDYVKAEPLFQRSLAILEQTGGPENTNVAGVLNNLAGLYNLMGDDQQAEPLYQRALAIWEKVFGTEHTMVAFGLSNLGTIYFARKDWDKAETFFQRALTIREKILGPNHPGVAESLSSLSLLYQFKRDYLRAEPLSRRALAIQEKVGGPNHPATALSLMNLANLVILASRDFEEAERLSQRALAIQEKTLGPDHPEMISSLNFLADLYVGKGDIARSIAYRIRGTDAAEHNLERNLISGSERQKQQYLKSFVISGDRTISLNIQQAPHDRAALEIALTLLLQRKGRALDAMANALATLRNQSDHETQKLLDEYTNLVGQISVQTLKGPGQKKLEDHLTFLKALGDEKEALEKTISRRSAEFKAQTAPVTLEDVQKNIPPDAALIEFVFYQPYLSRAKSPQLGVYVFDHKGNIQCADLGEAKQIEKTVSAFRKVLSTPKTNLAQEIKPIAQELDRLVMKPVRALVGNAKHLLISPDGALNLIPFAALLDEQGKFLIENYELTYLTSGRDLLKLAVKIKSHQPPLIIADPDYQDGNGPQTMERPIGRLTRLIGTQVEGNQIKAIFPEARLKMRAEATEQDFKQVDRPALVHIATHGYFLEDAPQPSETTPSDQLDRNIERATFNFEKERQANPLLRSMLFFAGANQGGTQDNDGVMTALEAAGLNLWGTKLVVLSACDTGLGDVKNGDGVYGLRRALILAGSEAQMMSLWPISDQATRELMVDYYTRLKAGEGRSQALRNVQLKFLKKPRRQHPFYWASFIQSGAWVSL